MVYAQRFLFCVLLALALAAVSAAASAPEIAVTIDGAVAPPTHGTSAGYWLFARDEGAQMALFGHPPRTLVISLDAGRRCCLSVPLAQSGAVGLRVVHLEGGTARVQLDCEGRRQANEVGWSQTVALRLDAAQCRPGAKLQLEISAGAQAVSLRIDNPEWTTGGQSLPLVWRPKERDYPQIDAVACSPQLRPIMERTLIEWDWRMQDGVGAPREPRTYAEAVDKTLRRGAALLDNLAKRGQSVESQHTAWQALQSRADALRGQASAAETTWESLWLDAHRWRRAAMLADPLADVGPLVFAKHVPSTMSHQLTQYYGYEARPGGGVCVLAEPGRSMRVRQLATSLPAGNSMHPEVSFDGKRIYWAFCERAKAPESRRDAESFTHRYHLYVMNSDGGQVQRLTAGDYDDFSPKCLPNGKLLFVSTRRGGFHRCGRGPCYVYTLALAEADGSNPRPISFHETNEWDPVLLPDGRVLYTRWDYVDRNAVFYQQLWSTWQDGSHVQIYYGNNTYNPVGTWEARPIPGSHKIMATGAPHHGMTAGSIIALDVSRGVDGAGPLTRLTPDAVFPESENGLAHGVTVDKPIRFDDELVKTWGPQPQSQASRIAGIPEEERRWPGHCYRSPYPLSEDLFLAAYSYDRLRGEPGANRPNMFGLYLCDALGNKELLYRDPNIASQWPVPLRARKKPPVLELASQWAQSTAAEPAGTCFLKNVYQSWPRLPDVEIRSLRVIQVLPKTTPHANTPRVGAANASPGKQVLGTVPVERDGSAYFRLPACTPVLFQALDARGRAVQTMRSLTYLQPGEQASCVGCHEPRSSAVAERGNALAAQREPSVIARGPDGSQPLSYPLLVQPVLERRCVECHNAKKPEGKVLLTGEPDKAFSRSYNALMPWVSYTAWGNPQNNFEPLTAPDQFGARASRLTQLLDRGHYDVRLSDEEWERLNTWMDANALFYGTFNPENQARQLRGERIAGPDLQ